MPNENCLNGLQCPKCGNNDTLRISCRCWATVRSGGVEVTEHEWDEDSSATCPKCHHTGNIASFDDGSSDVAVISADESEERQHPSDDKRPPESLEINGHVIDLNVIEREARRIAEDPSKIKSVEIDGKEYKMIIVRTSWLIK